MRLTVTYTLPAIVRTLNEALQIVADRSFYEDTRITPLVDVEDASMIEAYLVDEDHLHQSADWEWSYERGILDADSVSECSRLFEPSEFLSCAAHIRFHMGEAVERLESGISSVGFACVIVRDSDVIWNEETQAYYDAGGELADEIAGWALVAEWSDTV